MKVLKFLASREFRWPAALVLVVLGLVTLVLTKGESGVPFGLAMLAAFIAWDG